MHHIFEEIGQHLKRANYKGAKTTYRKNVGMMEVIVELEKGDDVDGFKVAVGSHPHMEMEKSRNKGRRAHVRDCANYKTILHREGREIWPFHQSIEERSQMIERILREVRRFESEADRL